MPRAGLSRLIVASWVMTCALAGPASAAQPIVSPVHEAPGGSVGTWLVGANREWSVARSDDKGRTSWIAEFELGRVIGFQSVRLLRYRYVHVAQGAVLGTLPGRRKFQDVSALYRIHLMPDHWSGPVIQLGPSVAFTAPVEATARASAAGSTRLGGFTVGAGSYTAVSTRVALRAEFAAERLDTGKPLTHRALWLRSVSIGLTYVAGGSQYERKR